MTVLPVPSVIAFGLYLHLNKPYNVWSTQPNQLTKLTRRAMNNDTKETEWQC